MAKAAANPAMPSTPEKINLRNVRPTRVFGFSAFAFTCLPVRSLGHNWPPQGRCGGAWKCQEFLFSVPLATGEFNNRTQMTFQKHHASRAAHALDPRLVSNFVGCVAYLPLECRFANNLFCENRHRFQYRVNWGKGATVDIRQASGIQLKNNVDLPLSAFEDPAALDFRIRPNYPVPDGIQRIPVEKIGLYLDAFRASMPHKADYRRNIRAKFEGKPSYDPDAVYDPERINEVLYR